MKRVLVAYLRFKLNWLSYVLSGMGASYRIYKGGRFPSGACFRPPISRAHQGPPEIAQKPCLSMGVTRARKSPTHLPTKACLRTVPNKDREGAAPILQILKEATLPASRSLEGSLEGITKLGFEGCIGAHQAISERIEGK